jgi:hypothetical protein
MTHPEPDTPTGRLGWRRHARGLLTERLGLKATAVGMSVLLWFVVGARQPTEGYVPADVAPDMDSSLVLVGEPPRLRVLVAGRASDLAKLYATPPVVRRTVRRNAPDSLELDISPADVRIPTDLRGDVRVLDVEPRRVTLRFARRAP